MVVYNQHGTVFDPSGPGQVPQSQPPLLRDELPSEFDTTKYAVRPAGARPNSVPYFYVNANHDHVEDPLAHLGPADGMKRTKLQFSHQDATRISSWTSLQIRTLR